MEAYKIDSTEESSALMPVYSRCDLMFERGEGVYLYTHNGRRYLDFAAGIAVNIFGHSHPHLVTALQEQAGKLWHVSNMYQIDGLERLARRLCDASFADQVFFCNSGAEAVECGIKMVRKFHDETGNPDKYRIITFEGCFHGRTMATISASKKSKVMDGFGPEMDGFDQVPFGDINAVRDAITPQTGGILIEPILGEGGVRPASAEFLRGLRKLADEHGLLLFFDEIQCGMGRTGKLFAHEWSGVEPDIVSSAKGIGGGFPLGACLATEHAACGMKPGTHGSTYAGNPLSVAVGNAVMDLLLDDDMFRHVRDIADVLHEKLANVVASSGGKVAQVRGSGLMLGLRIDGDAREFVALLREHGLLTVAAGADIVRILPPLTITRDHVEEACEVIEKALQAS